MMRALAEFIMRGRWQAATVALLGSWFPIVTPATVGLVGLRRGILDGAIICLWAVLPAVVALWASDVGALMAYSTIAVMLVVLVSAACLRMTMSWARTLMAMVIASVGAALVLSWSVPDVTSALREALGELAVPEQADASVPAAAWTEAAVGMVAYLVALSSLMALVVSRWWQALLYNPGGLQTEIHQLRLPPAIAVVSAGATLWFLLDGGSVFWANVYGLPLVVAGIGLVHFAVKAYGLGLMALVIFYAALVLVRPVLLMVAALAFVDAMINLRIRFKPSR